MDASSIGMTGPELAEVLRNDWKMETEMARGKLVLAMTSLCDDEDSLDRLALALAGIEKAAEDRQIRGLSDSEPSPESSKSADSAASEAPSHSPDSSRVWPSGVSRVLADLKPVTVCTLAQAREQDTMRIPLSDAAGKIWARYLYFYPPGIPFLAPGELITREHLQLLAAAQQSGETAFSSTDGTILCLRE